MKNKKIIILVLLLVVLGAAAWFFLLRGEEAPPRIEVLSMKIAIPSPGPGGPSPGPGGPSPGPGGPAPVKAAAKVEPGTIPPAPGVKKAPAPGPASGPAPAIPAAPKVKKVPAPAPTPQKTARVIPKPVKAAPTKVVKSAVSTKPFAINVSSFSTRAEADILARTISSFGYKSYVTKFIHKSRNWYRVRVGFYPTRAEAVKVQKTLSKRFNSPGAWVVQPARSEVAKHN